MVKKAIDDWMERGVVMDTQPARLKVRRVYPEWAGDGSGLGMPGVLRLQSQ
jgi:hypothetical protein